MTHPNWRAGAPAGNRNALKSGRYTAEQRAFDRELRLFLRRARQHIAWAKAVWAKEELERKNSKTTYPLLPDIPWFLPRKAGEGDRERSEWWRGRTQTSALLPAFGRTPPASGGRTMQAAHEFSKTTAAELRQKAVLRQLAEEFSKSTFAEFRQKSAGLGREAVPGALEDRERGKPWRCRRALPQAGHCRSPPRGPGVGQRSRKSNLDSRRCRTMIPPSQGRLHGRT